MKRNRMHYDPFDEGWRTACRIETRPGVRGDLVQCTSDVTKVNCLHCADTPEFDAAVLLNEVSGNVLVGLAHDRLLLLEPRDHRTLEQIRNWPALERAAVAVWSGRRHLRASDNIVAVPARPAIMDRDPEPEVPATVDIWGPRVCFCDTAAERAS